MVDASIGSSISSVVQRVVEGPRALLNAPLKGLTTLFVDAIPALDSENFEMSEFTISFGLDLGTEIGANGAIIVAKVAPSGNFQCTYKWSRKKKQEDA